MQISALGFDITKSRCRLRPAAAHHLGRSFVASGHEVRVMSPEYVRAYGKAQKNDDRYAEGIAEAASRSTMRFVELKS